MERTPITFGQLISKASQETPVYKVGNYLATVNTYKLVAPTPIEKDGNTELYETYKLELALQVGTTAQDQPILKPLTVNLVATENFIGIYNAMLEIIDAETTDELTLEEILNKLAHQNFWISLQRGQRIYWRPDARLENISKRIIK